MNRRTITIKIAARRRGAQPEAIEMELRPMEEEKALQLYEELTAACNGVIDKWRRK